MKMVRVIAKGSLAEVAETAATFGLYLENGALNALGEIVGKVSAMGGRDEMLMSRVLDWYGGTIQPPFPPGALLFFQSEGG